MKKWLLLLLLAFAREQVRYEDGPRMSEARLEVRYKRLFGREIVLSRRWVLPRKQEEVGHDLG